MNGLLTIDTCAKDTQDKIYYFRYMVILHNPGNDDEY
jgi:hypothetical protein